MKIGYEVAVTVIHLAAPNASQATLNLPPPALGLPVRTYIIIQSATHLSPLFCSFSVINIIPLLPDVISVIGD